jgi:hypothetical protein
VASLCSGLLRASLVAAKAVRRPTAGTTLVQWPSPDDEKWKPIVWMLAGRI